MGVTVLIISDFFPEEILMQADQSVINSIIADVMEGARSFWIKRAGEKLHGSRRDYVQGIQTVETEDGLASIALVGVLPNLVESGMSAFDMRDTLLGPNVPVAPPGGKGKHVNAKGQFYRSIPFRHQVPGTIGQGGGPPMGSAYTGALGSGAAAALGKSIHKAAQQLSATKGIPGGGTQWGGRLPAGLAPKLKSLHSTDIYAGMVRQQKTYAQATQNTYTTFRTISEGGNPAKWLHPGITAANISDDVVDYVLKNAPLAFEMALGAGP